MTDLNFAGQNSLKNPSHGETFQFTSFDNIKIPFPNFLDLYYWLPFPIYCMQICICWHMKLPIRTSITTREKLLHDCYDVGLWEMLTVCTGDIKRWVGSFKHWYNFSISGFGAVLCQYFCTNWSSTKKIRQILPLVVFTNRNIHVFQKWNFLWRKKQEIRHLQEPNHYQLTEKGKFCFQGWLKLKKAENIHWSIVNVTIGTRYVEKKKHRMKELTVVSW